RGPSGFIFELSRFPLPVSCFHVQTGPRRGNIFFLRLEFHSWSFGIRSLLMRRVLSAGFVFVAFIGLSGQQARADVKLPALFSDGMVLQSGTTTPIWGTADPGEDVSVVL